ncbi:MAG: hypothetical protein R3Y26_00570 [Rikenellaceae bacterium]
MKTILVYIFILASLLGCTSTADYAYLKQADNVMNTPNLDSAQMMLDAVNPATLSNLGKAYHAFLSSYIPYKRYEVAESDSLINVAIDYFKRNQTDNLLARSYLVRSGILADMGYKNQAMINSIKAETVADTSDYLTLAVINMQLATLYKDSYIFNKEISIDRYKKALYYYCKCNDKLSESIMLNNIGIMYHSISFDSVAHYLQEAISVAKECNNIITETGSVIKLAQLAIHNDTMLIESKNNLVNMHQTRLTREWEVLTLCNLVNAYTKLNSLDSAEYYANKLLQKDDSELEFSKNFVLHKLYKQKENYKLAYHHLELANNIRDSIFDANRAQELYAIEKEFDYSEANTKAHKAEVAKQQLIIMILIVSIVIILLTILIIRFIRRKMQRTKEELALSQELIESLRASKAMIEQQMLTQSRGDNASNPILVCFIELIEKLPNYEEHQPKKFIAAFKDVMQLSNKNSAMSFICNIVNESYNGAVYNLRDEYSLQLYELALICMVCLGFSNSAMRVVYEHTNNNTIYNYKSAVKRKLSLESCDREVIVDFLTKRQPCSL